MKIIIVGAGEVGFHIAGHLSKEENKEVVVIDKNPAALRRLKDSLDIQTIAGSGSSPVILKEAGIREAESLLAVTDQDETNLVACLVAELISPGTKKLARIREADFDTFNGQFSENPPHIDTIINPDIEAVRTIEQFMSVPGAVDVGEFAGGRLKLIGIRLHEDTPLAGSKLLDLPEKTGGRRILISSIVRDEQLIIPSGNDRIESGDLIYFISEEKDLRETLHLFGKRTEPVRRVLIVGGGRISLRLAKRLAQKSIYTKIVESRKDRCDFLAESLDKAVVLCGDGSDQDLLKEENIQDTDVVITLTNDDETNILTSLLVKRMGVRKTITKISKFSYFPLMQAIGIEQVVDPRLSAIDSILQHIRRGKILSSITLKGENGEVIEAQAMETSEIVGRPLMEVSLPAGVLVTAIIRGEAVIIPSGNSIIEPNDHIILFARRDAIPKMEKILAVKLEYV